jgi:hypothetical protein
MHHTPTMPSRWRASRVLAVALALVAVAVGSAACSQAAAPDPPASIVAAPGDGLIGVTWFAPADQTGLTGYQVTAEPGHHSCSIIHKLHCVISGLTNGQVFKVDVRSVGPGGTSSPVQYSVTAGVPWIPGYVAGVPGDSTATVSWLAPLSPGHPITSYTVTALPGFQTCTSTTTKCTVDGLTNDAAYTFVVRAANAIGSSPASPPSPAVTPSTFAGGSPGVTYLGEVSASQETSTGSILQRDAGVSVALSSGRDLWIFGDTSSFSANTYQSSAFIGGSTAASGHYVPGKALSVLKDIEPAGSTSSSTGAPSQFIPTPSDTYMPDGSGRACTPANGAVYTARWPTGAALLNTEGQVLVTYSDVCVTSATSFTVEGWGWMIFVGSGNKARIGPIDVFPPAPSGAPLPDSRTYQSPLVANGQVTLFTSTCTALFVACAAGNVTATTLSDTPQSMGLPSSYAGGPAVTVPTTQWTPVNISVGSYPDGLRLVEQTSIGGTFVVFSSASPTGPWNPIASGTLPGCSTTPRGFCYAFVGHPELGSSTSLILSYFKPDSAQNANVGHIYLASVATPSD